MRKIIILAGLAFTTSQFASAAMPYLHGSDTPSAVRPGTSTSSKWNISRLWGKQEQPLTAQQVYQNKLAPPTTTQRISNAVTNNAAVNTARSWMATDASVPTVSQQADPISLRTPVGPPTPDLMVSMAQLREKQGDMAGARQTYQQAIAAAPKNVNILREMGHFEDRQNRLKDAERIYAEAAKLEPKNAGVLNDLALCLARQGNSKASAQVLEQAIRLAPQKPLYRNNVATVLMEMGQQHQAMQHLMAIHPPAAAYYNMGHLLEKGDQDEAAAAHYAEALRLDPSMTAAQTSLARVAPEPPASVPQTAMNTQAKPPSFAPQTEWPSEPIKSPAPEATRREPNFGPRLLPPVE